MGRDAADLRSIHRFSTGNRPLLAVSERAGCFYCRAIFHPDEISDWTDGAAAESGDTQSGVTALCPRCGIDAVLPSAAITLDPELLAEMHDHWFE